jgi:alkylation response protein AidB-like acyl-CoA dehydrogenase
MRKDLASSSNAATRSEELLSAAERLTPLIREYADQTERDRKLAAPVVEAMQPLGLLSTGLPQSLGGPELPVASALKVIEQLSYADGATGWNAMIAYDTGLLAGYLSARGARELLRLIRMPVVAGSIQPPGRLQRVADGYRLSGRWRFGSGCQQANAFIVAAILVDGDQPKLDADGHPVMCEIVLPAAQVKIVDTWRVAGMRGTGSHDFMVEGLPVKEDFVQPFNFDAPVESGPLYGFPLVGNLAVAKTAVALGIARHAIEAFSELAQVKMATHHTNLLRERAAVQSDLARAEACVRSARYFLEGTVDEVWTTVAEGKAASDRQRAMLRLAAVDGVQRAVAAVDLMFNAAGATAIHEASPLERCFRDIHVVPAHFVVQPSTYEIAGRVLLGLPPGTPLF